MKTSEIFEREIGFIENETMRKIVADTLDAAPECIQYIPASSSGKYHPKADLGEGGLVRHIKTVTAICMSLMRSNCFKDIALGTGTVDEDTLHIYEDVALAACILHDCCKPDDTKEHRTAFDHPLIAAQLFFKCCRKYIISGDYDNFRYMSIIMDLTSDAIASHMGRWSTSPYSTATLPEPKTGIEVFVHLCDYLASRKFIDMNFDVYENDSNWE